MAGIFLRVWRWAIRLLLLLLIVDLFYVALTWPDWNRLAAGPVPKSKFISAYQASRLVDHNRPGLRWQPVSLMEMPAYLRRAVIVAEDSRFYQHGGFDLIAFKEAMDYNVSRRRLALGASTISQQTVKNMFLSSSRNPLRKWHELLLTWGMERNLTKNRILEIYLNVAEFGPGIYGVEAAARAYWGKSVSRLTPVEAAELAAALPSPKKNNPATRTQRFKKRVQKISGFLVRFGNRPSDDP
ncbi:MAG: hypothetical protein BMS9Abin10_0933 [Gammaproteobacteria bacterium]|nr:MAG: hypothetical protein BMS9Abin10_0933 [Gammaproteobacteria bacterium]